MIISFWRYSHLSLAIVSSIFLIIASVTGIILSFSSINEEIQNKNRDELDEISISTLIDTLSKKYLETTSIEIKKNGLVEANVIDNEANLKRIYVDPKTGNEVSAIAKENKVFSVSRNIHRSLLLKKTGRFIIGVVSFLLLLISITGIALIIKRQVYLKKFYSKIIYDNFFQYWHTFISRYSLFFIVIIALTGCYLSMERFKMIDIDTIPKHKINLKTIKTEPEVNRLDFPILKKTKLSEIEKLDFPFSPFPEDGEHFHLRMKDKDLIINQFTGKIISQYNFDSSYKLSKLSFNLHTGYGSISWSIILCVSCIFILFFIYSGYNITWNRWKSKKKNVFKSNKSNYIILVGSENGNTLRFARKVYDLLILNKEKVFIDYLNNYKKIKKDQHLLIITSTYGKGDPPYNAKKFIKRFKKNAPKEEFSYSILGFGSKRYPDYCSFALKLDTFFKKKEVAICNTPIHLINNQSQKEFDKWRKEWCNNNHINLIHSKKDETCFFEEFVVLKKSDPKKDPNKNFKLVLKQKSITLNFQSGDLIAFTPPNNSQERLYSIAKDKNNNILLCIKKHDAGICSSHLSKLDKSELIKGRIIRNEKFHSPQKKGLILIANGTGIAPFIGIANENKNHKEICLYWGVKSKKSTSLFRKEFEHLIKSKKLSSAIYAFSKDKKHVQDIVKKEGKTIAKKLENGQTVMICGSINMEKDILKILDKACEKNNEKSISYYENRGQIKTDCY